MTIEKIESDLRQSQEENMSSAEISTELSSKDNEISHYNLFHDIPYDLLEPVLADCSVQHLQKDEILITPDQENHNLYLLISGRLQVYLDSADAQISFPIERGECIGEMSLIEDRKTSAFVVAQEDCSLIVMPKDIFWDKFIYLPRAIKNLLLVLINRTRKDNEVIRQSMEKQFQLELLQKELEAAGQIQANILPQGIPLFPDQPQVDVCAMMEPAKEVGGDFYDAFALDKDRICIAIGDVSGKGMPAALFMVRIITLLRMTVSQDGPFETVLPTLNQTLCENNDDCMFVTLFVGVFDVKTGTLTYLNAGHNPPFYSTKGGPFNLIDLPKGILLGISETARYEVATLMMQPDDMLVLYTDGVTEAENPQHEFYSVDRACQTLQTVSGNDDITSVVKALSDSVAYFAKGLPQADDITILALRYRGENN